MFKSTIDHTKMVTKQNSPQASNTNIWQNMSRRFDLNLLEWNVLGINCGRGAHAPVARAEEPVDAAAQARHLDAGEIRRARPQAGAEPAAGRHPHAAGGDHRRPPIAARRSDVPAALYSAAHHLNGERLSLFLRLDAVE
uniref:Uncharacterized protein n=1 Tax=Arundo donax TaxID=35708 RepID=A0A0A9DEG9_ARUDO